MVVELVITCPRCSSREATAVSGVELESRWPKVRADRTVAV